MRYHYNKALACDFLYKVHYLDGSVGIERARGFVGKQNFGIVDEGAGDCHPLHLAARKLVGALVQLGAEAYAVERLGCASLWRSLGLTPESVRASSTLASTVW